MNTRSSDPITSHFTALLLKKFGRPIDVRTAEIQLSTVLTRIPPYQRTLRAGALRDILEGFNALAAGVLYVNERSDGTVWLVDGNHRGTAAAEHGFQTWPAIKTIGLDKKEEARLWRDLNRHRSPVAKIEDFNAALVEREPQAARIHRAARRYGFRFPFDKKGTGSRIATVSPLYRADDQGMLDQLLDIVSRGFLLSHSSNGTDYYATRGDTLNAILLLLAHPDTKDKLDVDRLIKQLSRSRGARALHAEAQTRISGRTPFFRLLAEQIAHVYNSRLRDSDKLPEAFRASASAKTES